MSTKVYSLLMDNTELGDGMVAFIECDYYLNDNDYAEVHHLNSDGTITTLHGKIRNVLDFIEF